MWVSIVFTKLGAENLSFRRGSEVSPDLALLFGRLPWHGSTVHGLSWRKRAYDTFENPHDQEIVGAYSEWTWGSLECVVHGSIEFVVTVHVSWVYKNYSIDSRSYDF